MRLVSALATVALASPILAQSWTQRFPTTSPSARFFPTMGYDSSRQRTVLFGGGTASGQLGDTWEWDGQNWNQMNPTTSPPPRTIATMEYDSVRRRMVLFGGNSGTARLSDTWEWNGQNWTQVTTAAAPPARGGHAMCYDFLRQRTVMLGGTPNGVWSAVMAGVWEYDGTTWTNPVTVAAPPDRAQHQMAHDPVSLKTLLFGGGDKSANKLNDTWLWDGSAWTKLTPATSPPARYWHALATDTDRFRTILFGGSAAANTNDLWEWNGFDWKQIPTANPPPARNAHGMAYDSARRRLVVFGGRGTSSSGTADTWEYEGGPTLTTYTPTISIATGGKQSFALTAGIQHATKYYLVAGSFTGTTPGFSLPGKGGSVPIPLNPDAWTSLSLEFANRAFFGTTHGLLDANGNGQASLTLPVINDPTAVGLVLHHAYVLYDAQFAILAASDPVSLLLVR